MCHVYDYRKFSDDLGIFRRKHPKIPVFSIGKTVENRELYAIRMGNGRKRVFFHGAHHAQEWLTARLLMTFAWDYAEEMEPMWKKNTLYLVPMVNPDGIEMGKTSPLWQANARGVDLNHNYDARWHQSKLAEQEQKIFGPGPTRFSGPFPESEPETKAVANFTRENAFDLTLSFHSQGEVIYWDFCGFAPKESLAYLDRFEAVSPYRRDIPMGISGYGGYKDWFLQTFKKPGFTIEIGKGSNPLPPEDFDEIYQKTRPLILEALRFEP